MMKALSFLERQTESSLFLRNLQTILKGMKERGDLKQQQMVPV